MTCASVDIDVNGFKSWDVSANIFIGRCRIWLLTKNKHTFTISLTRILISKKTLTRRHHRLVFIICSTMCALVDDDRWSLVEEEIAVAVGIAGCFVQAVSNAVVDFGLDGVEIG